MPDADSDTVENTGAEPNPLLIERRNIARRRLLLSGSMILAGMATLGYYWPKRWRYIVVHHSAGDYGTIEFLQRVHRQRQAKDPIDAIPYHYVIGNGNGLGDGEIASDRRGQWHIWGAHVSSRNSVRNYYGLGICLIGNFEQHPPTAEQYQALLQLTRELMQRYHIPASKVSGHGYTPGERTRCPGKMFPIKQFLAEIGGPLGVDSTG